MKASGAVVQQGRNAGNRTARRYHWHSAAVWDFICDPHPAIGGPHQGTIGGNLSMI
jgi:hypothetical protein